MKLRFKPRLSSSQLLTLIVVGLTLGLLSVRLGSLTPGLSHSEHFLPSVHSSLQTVWQQPLGLPATLAQLLVAAILPTAGLTASRLPSVLLGLLVALITYALFRRWYGFKLSLFGIILTITAPWFLHVARLATTDVLYPLSMLVVLLLCARWHQVAKQPERANRLLYMTALLASLTLYVPGAIWLLLIGFIFERREVVGALKTHRKHTILSGLLSLVVLTPLIHAFISDWRLYRPWLGLPAAFPSILVFGEHLIRVWQYLFIGGFTNPLYNVAGMPLINSLVTIAFGIGIYLYSQHPKASRTKQLLSLWLVSTALIALGGPVGYALIMPLVITVAMGGIGYLLHAWLKVFPRNPLARGFGIGLIGLLVTFAVAYNLRNYFVAWPHVPATRTAFTQQP